jgi:hypothetical protein
MALAIVQSRNIEKQDFSSPLTFAFTSTPTDGSLLLLFCANNLNNTHNINTPSGWTLVGAEPGAAGEVPGAAVFCKWASAESNSYDVASDIAAWNGNVCGVELSGGAGSGDPADVPVVENVPGFTAPVLKSVTTITDSCYVFALATQYDADPGGFSTPTGWTKLLEASDRGGALYYIVKTTAGATGDETLTGGNGFGNVTYTYAIRPAATAADYAMPHDNRRIIRNPDRVIALG